MSIPWTQKVELFYATRFALLSSRIRGSIGYITVESNVMYEIDKALICQFI